LTLVIFALGFSGLVVAIRGATHKPSEIFPQNQDCQSEAVALRLRFASPRAPWWSPAVPDPEPRTRFVTNCRRIGFQFFLKTLELTALHFGSIPGSIWKKLYGLNGDGEKDLIVHVSHVQPALSIMDPTISTNLNVLSFEHDLQPALARFDGNRERLEGYDVDIFWPYPDLDAFWARLGDQPRGFYFLSRSEGAAQFVGRCERFRGMTGWCKILVYSQQDGFAFGLRVPEVELVRLNGIIERTLGLIRSWRAPA
jgi:hypothetical protein